MTDSSPLFQSRIGSWWVLTEKDKTSNYPLILTRGGRAGAGEGETLKIFRSYLKFIIGMVDWESCCHGDWLRKVTRREQALINKIVTSKFIQRYSEIADASYTILPYEKTKQTPSTLLPLNLNYTIYRSLLLYKKRKSSYGPKPLQ